MTLAMIPATLNAKVRRLHLWARGAVEDWLGGAYRSVFKGVGIAFEEVREYQPGDDVRAIDWNVTARIGTPFIKRFVEERELTVMLALDLGESMAFGSGVRTKRQSAAETLALIVLAAVRNNDRVGLLLSAGNVQKLIPPRKGTRHALRLLRDLLQAGHGEPLAGHVRRVSESGMGAGLQTIQRVLHRRALVFVASDFALPGYERPLRWIAARHDVIALFPQDEWESALPDVGMLALRDPDTGGALVLDTHDVAIRDQYRARMAERVRQLSHTVRRSGADWIGISTDGSHLEALRQFFRRRERRNKPACR